MARVYPCANAGRKVVEESPAVPPALPLTQAAAEWHRITGAPRPHRATLARWCIRGCRGIRLRGERSGGQWVVTSDALREFHQRLNVPPEHAVDRSAGPARAAEIARSLSALDDVIAGRSPA
jgi:hypothetical protein